jgi:hypothetical protein
VRPSLAAFRTASPRLAAPSLRRIADTWLSTVRGDTNSLCAISALRSPSATSARISLSRAVNPAGFVRVEGLGPRRMSRTPSARRRLETIAAAGAASSR